jgi:hypothetical protein
MGLRYKFANFVQFRCVGVRSCAEDPDIRKCLESAFGIQRGSVDCNRAVNDVKFLILGPCNPIRNISVLAAFSVSTRRLVGEGETSLHAHSESR